MASDFREFQRSRGDDVDEAIAHEADVYFAQGFRHFEADDDDAAIDSFTETIRLDPQSALAYFYRGFVYNRNGDYGAAIADFSEAIRNIPTGPGVLLLPRARLRY